MSFTFTSHDKLITEILVVKQDKYTFKSAFMLKFHRKDQKICDKNSDPSDGWMDG